MRLVLYIPDEIVARLRDAVRPPFKTDDETMALMAIRQGIYAYEEYHRLMDKLKEEINGQQTEGTEKREGVNPDSAESAAESGDHGGEGEFGEGVPGAGAF